MAVKLVSSTKIYLDARKLLDITLSVVHDFPREYKFTIGSKLQEISVNLMQEIAAAYINRDKAETIKHLTEFQAEFETMKTLMRIAVMKREKYHIGGKTLVMTESNGVMISVWVDNNNINNKNN